MTFIVIEDIEETKECLDTLEASMDESGVCLKKVKNAYSDDRDTDSRAWLVRFLIDRDAEFADGNYTVDPGLLQDAIPRKRPKRKARARGGKAKRGA